MDKQRVREGALVKRLRVRAANWGVSAGAAVLGIGIALIAMTAVVLLFATLGVESAPLSLSSAAQDAAVAIYAVQLVGLSFFNHTAGLRFAALPGLLLVGLSVAAATAAAVRVFPGPARRKMTMALAVSIPYALLMGLAGLFLPLHFTAPGFGTGVAIAPSPTEAFLLPLGWGLLFASVGGLVAVHGRNWRREASRLLGAWATPLAVSLRVLAVGLLASAAVALVGILALAGGDLGWATGGGAGRAIRVLGAAVVTLPTLAAAVLVSGFAVPFSWSLDALSHGVGSVSVLGGTLPSTSQASQAPSAPAMLVLAPVIALLTVFAIGWQSARRSGSDAKLGLANTARAATLTTLAVWLLALLARVDAQAGGLLGFHLSPDAGALLWRVPLLTFTGCFAGGFSWALSQGRFARRRLAATLRDAVQPSRWEWRPEMSRLTQMGQGLKWRAALMLSFVALPVSLVGMGATGSVTAATTPKVSMAPIAKEAEQELEKTSTDDEAVAVTVDPETRAVSTATVNTPLRALGIAPAESRAAKAEGVVERYGEMLGLSEPAEELGKPQTDTSELGVTHVSFPQTADGLPVFGGGVGVHLAHKGELLNFVSSSVIPDVSVDDDETKISSQQAVEVAKKALPSGSVAAPAKLQVYAGLPPYTSGPNARLAWFVWLISENEHASNEYVVDAVTGQVLDTIPRASDALYREVYDAGETAELPGELAREEGEEPAGDEDVNHAYEYTGDVYNFFQALLERDSFDGEGSPLISTVHFAQASGAPFENAYWNGQQLVFGSGFPAALDIVGHELTHAYTEYTSGLVAQGQSGALNESLSDIMGVAIEMANTGEVNWLIGEKLPGELGPLRNLAEPGEIHELEGAGDNSPDPAELAEWVATCLDSLGIHINSTITSHAFYLATTHLAETQEIPVEEAAAVMSILFFRGLTEYLAGNPTATLEDARAATLQATKDAVGEESAEYEVVEAAFTEVGLNGTAQPTFKSCEELFECSFARALQTQHSVSGSKAASMLTTLYEARGELAQPSAAGHHFLPLYEGNMVRISELVSEDPTLDQIAVNGLTELTPALEALMEGEGEQFELTPELMERIEAALKRLAQDDRVFEGPHAGELADMIEEELEWMGLPSYASMGYQAGFARLNNEVEAQALSEESGVIIDPNCSGKPYPNNFHVNGFYVDTPGHRIPGQVSPLETGGVICGAEVEVGTGESGCPGEETLNTAVKVDLPPGDKVNSTKNLASGSWVGEAVGYAIACAGNETRRLYGQAGLLSLSSWSASQCPTTAIACYEGKTEYQPPEGETVIGRAYSWVAEEEGQLTLTTKPVAIASQGYTITASFGQFEIGLCARAGSAASQECGGPSATWVHQNGEASETGCPEGKGRYEAVAENAASETTAVASSCVLWQQNAHMQTIDAPNNLTAVSCVPGSTTCVAADNKGNAFYSTNVSSGAAATWNAWSGPGVSPGEAVECPSASLCLLAAGEVSGGGGNLYRATSLGGSFLNSFKPANGVGAISCPSSSFCVTAMEGGGFIRYSTNPSGILWTAVTIGSGAMKDVSCLSNSFCAVVDGAGNIRVATTEKRVKEAAGWTATNIGEEKALRAVACSSTTSCVALDGGGEALKVTIEQPSGAATVSRVAVAGGGELNEVTCNGSDCVAVDTSGGIFASTDGGSTWQKRFASASNLSSVSCASSTLCASVDTSGDLAMFDPE